MPLFSPNTQEFLRRMDVVKATSLHYAAYFLAWAKVLHPAKA